MCNQLIIFDFSVVFLLEWKNSCIFARFLLYNCLQQFDFCRVVGHCSRDYELKIFFYLEQFSLYFVIFICTGMRNSFPLIIESKF